MLEPSLSGIKIQLRKSNIKFPSPDMSLNVVRCATASQGYLNRQMIVMLHCLGVPDEVFMKMQKRAKEYASVASILTKMENKSKRMNNAFKLNHKTME